MIQLFREIGAKQTSASTKLSTWRSPTHSQKQPSPAALLQQYLQRQSSANLWLCGKICSNNLQQPSAATSFGSPTGPKSAAQQQTSATTMCKNHLRQPSAETICSNHLQQPSAANICTKHLQHTSAPTIFSNPFCGDIGDLCSKHLQQPSAHLQQTCTAPSSVPSAQHLQHPLAATVSGSASAATSGATACSRLQQPSAAPILAALLRQQL